MNTTQDPFNIGAASIEAKKQKLQQAAADLTEKKIAAEHQRVDHALAQMVAQREAWEREAAFATERMDLERAAWSAQIEAHTAKTAAAVAERAYFEILTAAEQGLAAHSPPTLAEHARQDDR